MKIDKSLAQVGRVALRAEGENWNAYFADPKTMEGAVYLGSIKLTLVERADRKNAFIQLMRDTVGDMMEETLGVRPIWPTPPQPAPEHERTRS
jgi:hypothetical protein